MLFPEISPAREQIFSALADALAAERARIYLDASLLIHSYEISAAARDELLSALDTFGPRLGVPVWAARETWDFMRSRITRRPLEAPASRLRNQLDQFRKEALRYVDDDTLSDLSKEDYQRQLDAAVQTVTELARQVERHEPKADDTTARLMPFIETHRLKSDLAHILEVVARTADARSAHAVPPGFADSPTPRGDSADETGGRGRGKQKNPNGDLIIWLEALGDCAAIEAEHLVILTRDTTKGDWVYVPDKIKDEQGRPQNNAGMVTMPLPLLVHEATLVCPSLKSLHIVSLEMLARVLRRNLRISVPNLAAALQTEVEQPRRTTPPEAPPPDGGPPPAGDVPAEEPSFSSSDMTYDFPRGDEIDDQLRSLSVEGWHVQNQAVRRIEPLLRIANRDQLVQIGRGMVAAANEGAIEPADFLRRVFADASLVGVHGHMLVGVLAEIYIAETGEPKKPQASLGLIDLIYGQEQREELQPAYRAVLGRLTAQRRTYVALPTDHATPIRAEVTLEGARLRDVRVFNNPLLEGDAPPSRALRPTGQATAMTVADLMIELSREFVVPATVLSPDTSLAFQLQVPENIGYVLWGPNTGATLR
jgi:PIN like domain